MCVKYSSQISYKSKLELKYQKLCFFHYISDSLFLFLFLFYMGARFSRIAKRFLPKSKVRILMVGLDGSGKTTILYKLKLGDVVTTVPTIGM